MAEQKIKILIVDDDQNTREMYTEVFRGENFEVVEAKDGVEALDSATTSPPNIVFTGIVMPRMDGFGLMESLKKNITTKDIPIVISSHLGREEDREKARRLGASSFIVLGVTTPNEVVERVKNILQKGMEYRAEFDAYALDASKLAKDLHLNSNFQCLECNQRMVLLLKMKNIDSKEMTARLVCPQCGWTPS